jgi:hypothetical protein
MTSQKTTSKIKKDSPSIIYKMGKTPIELSWDRRQWVLKFGNEQTYHTELNDLYTRLVNIAMKKNAKELVSIKEVKKAHDDAYSVFNKMQSKLNKELDQLREKTNIE